MLDVLDLHDNLLNSTAGFEELVNLRVLNIAGNRIERINGLLTLTNLVELNLKRNMLVSLCSLSTSDIRGGKEPSIPQNLKYLFLSHNRCKCCCIFFL